MRTISKARVTINDHGGDLSKRWYVYLSWIEDGKRFRRKYYLGINRARTVTARRAEARVVRRIVQEHLDAGYIPAASLTNDQPGHSLSQIIDAVLEHKRNTLRPDSLRSYKAAAEKYYRYLESDGLLDTPDVLSQVHAVRYQRWLSSGLSNTSVNHYIRHLRVLIAGANDLGHQLPNPFKDLRPIPETAQLNVAFTPMQRAELKAYLSANDPGLWLFVQFVYYCFLRPNELVQLHRHHLDLEAGRVVLPGSIAKNRQVGYVAIPEVFLPVVRSALQGVPGDQYVFATPTMMPGPKPIRRDSVTKRHQRHLAKLGIDGGATLYSWKHTGVVAAVQAGANIREVQNQLRHSSLEMVAKYLRSLGIDQSNTLSSQMPEL